MKDERSGSGKLAEAQERVAIFGENDHRLARPAQQADEGQQLRLACTLRRRCLGNPLEQPRFGDGILEDRPHPSLLVVRRIEIAVGIPQIERELPVGADGRAFEKAKAPLDRPSQGMRARQRPFLYRGRREPRVALHIQPLGPHHLGERGDGRVHPRLAGGRADRNEVNVPGLWKPDVLPRSPEDQQRIAARADAAQ